MLATGTQVQDLNKTQDLNNMFVDEVIIAAEGLSTKTPALGGTPIRSPPQKVTIGIRRKQSTMPENRPQCEEATQYLERAEWSLLFLTTAGAVCQIGNHDWYGMCVLTLAMLATGAQAKEVSGSQGGGYHMGERISASKKHIT